jgi:hypothetical protein
MSSTKKPTVTKAVDVMLPAKQPIYYFVDGGLAPLIGSPPKDSETACIQAR